MPVADDIAFPGDEALGDAAGEEEGGRHEAEGVPQMRIDPGRRTHARCETLVEHEEQRESPVQHVEPAGGDLPDFPLGRVRACIPQLGNTAAYAHRHRKETVQYDERRGAKDAVERLGPHEVVQQAGAAVAVEADTNVVELEAGIMGKLGLGLEQVC